MIPLLLWIASLEKVQSRELKYIPGVGEMKNAVLKLTALAILIGVCFVQAQTTSTQILGTVTDPSGASVAGATVEILRTETGEKRSATTDSSGGYIMPALEIGTYDVTVQAAGFQRLLKRGIVLELNQKARVDFTLKVGSITDTVSVIATAPVLKTDDATIGEVVNRELITELPLNGRNFAQLAIVAAPGVRLGYQTFGGGERLYASGQRENENQFTMDGSVIQDNLINTVSFRPSIEAIEEFKVQTGSFSAEYGMFSGAQVNLALRAGGNDLHATFFEFLRNDALDARTFFELPSQPKAPLRRNQFGAVISGPVYIPKVYKGHDKTFFMFNSEILRNRLAGSNPTVVAPLAFRTGDFSSLLPKTLIRDPLTGQPFANNLIPQNRLSSQALALLNYMPKPNQAGTLNYQSRTRSDEDNNQYLTRVDHVFNEKDRLFMHYVYQTDETRGVAANPFDIQFVLLRDQNVTVNENHIFSPNMINEFNMGYTRLRLQQSNEFTGTNFSILKTFGMVGFPEDSFTTGFPGISITGYQGLSNFGPLFQIDETEQLADNLSIIRGNHAFKMGADIRHGRDAREAANNPRASLAFNGQITGNAFADFMLGLPQNVTGIDLLDFAEARNWRYGLYFMDDWKVSPRLTLNLGVRYELNTVPTDPYGRLRTLDPKNPTQLYPAPGTVASLYKGNHLNFAPRFGFAYRPFGNKTVLRGGYGIYYDQNQLNNFTLLHSNPPYHLAATLINQPTNPTITLANPLLTNGTLPTGPFNIISVDTCGCLPTTYAQMTTFSIGHQITENLGVEVTYLHSLAVHLDRSDYPNWPAPGPGAVQPRRPNPIYATIRMIRNDVTSNYNALQVQARKRLSSGLTFQTNYAWSHTIDDGNDVNLGTAVEDPSRRYLERGNSQFDFRHRFTQTFVYALPFYHTGSSRMLRALIRGWQLDGILTLESGQPFSVMASGDVANTGSTGQRANRIADGNLPSSERSTSRWFDTSAFVNPAPFTYGNAGRFILRQAPTRTLDAGLFKNFFFTEKQMLQFRTEAFSVTNSPVFGTPGTTVGTSTFGVVTSLASAGGTGGNRVLQFGLKYSF